MSVISVTGCIVSVRITSVCGRFLTSGASETIKVLSTAAFIGQNVSIKIR